MISFELFEFEACIEYMYSQVEVPFSINGFPGEVCATRFAKKSKYFEYLFKNAEEEVSIYRPFNINNEEYYILLEAFVLYINFGKIILH